MGFIQEAPSNPKLATIIVLLVRLGTPESPRWLNSKRRVAEGKALAAEYVRSRIESVRAFAIRHSPLVSGMS